LQLAAAMSRWLFAVTLLIASAAPAAVFLVPPDVQMIHEADAVVVATVREMNGRFDLDGAIVTDIRLDVEQVLKGDIDAAKPLIVQRMGGVVGEQFTAVSDNVEYWKDNRALIFLDRRDDGIWTTYGLSLGKFDSVTDGQKRQLAVRWATNSDVAAWTPDGKPHEERYRDWARFVAFVRHMVANPPLGTGTHQPDAEVTDEGDYFVENVDPEELSVPEGYRPPIEGNSHVPASSYTQGAWRWRVFDSGGSVSFQVSGTQPGHDSIGAAQRALAAWTNDTGSNVDYRYGGTSTRDFAFDGFNTIVYNHPTAVPSGAIAYAQWSGGAPHTYKGESFYSISEGDVVVRQGLNVSATVFDEAVTHEVGHTLGFRHSDQGTPSSTQAVMKAVLTGAYGASLGPWDIEAVRHVYESTQQQPNVPGVPGSLVATAAGTTAVTITWNASPNATGYELQRSTNNSSWTTIASTTATSYGDTGRTADTTYLYRVRATNSGGASAYSNVDHATTIVFVDDPLGPGIPIKAVHLTQLRTAVNAVRVAAGLGAFAWTDPNPAGVPPKVVHITELRTALQQALLTLNKSSSFTDPTLTPDVTPVRAIHFQELRNYTK
jgi:hypothetical protein